MKLNLQRTSVSRWPVMARRLKTIAGKSVLAGALLSAGWLFPAVAQAQLANQYNFAASAGTFTPLAATATQVPALKADSYIMPATTFPGGFVFNYEGVNYTQFKATSNGTITFNITTTSVATSNGLASAATSARPVLAPLWDDLDGNATGGSNASYEVTGTAGSQVFTFEWLNWEFNYGSADPVISFQVKLYEATGKIEFIYRPESGAVTSGSASIGIAGAAAGNYLSLNNFSTNPAVSSTSETTSINTKPAAGQTYSFTKPVATDIGASALALPAGIGCYGANQTVSVTVKNYGTSPINFATNPLTVSANATGLNPATFTPVTVNTGTLAAGATQNVVVSTAYNMTAVGTYTFNATATVTGDGFTPNDAMPPQTRTIAALAILPQSADFTGFTGSNLTTLFPNWTEASGATLPAGISSNWTTKTGLGGTGNVTAKINLYSNTAREWLVGPKFTATTTSALRFKAAVTDYDAFTVDADGMTGTDDKVQVMVSTDCGATFTPIFTMDAASNLTNTLAQQSVSLAAYAGQNIIVAFFASEGTVDNSPDYDFHIDDVFIGTPPTADLGVTAFVNPATAGCYGATQNVTVTIQNFGIAPIDFAVTNATVSVKSSGALANTISIPVISGTLAANATQNISVGTLNMTATGVYNLKAYTTFTGDNNAANDTARTSRTIAPIAVLPQNVDFTGYTGSNLTTVFPNWREGSGATTPGGTISNWTTKTGLGSGSNITAKINLYSNLGREWLVGPKVIATATTNLKFKAAVTDYDALTVDAAGMTGTDDKVQVMVSTDCGATFTPIFTMDAASNLTNTLAQQNVSLAAYAGQNIIVAFFATEGTVNDNPDYDFHIDDINLYNIAPVELEMLSITLPTNGCGMTATETICVTIRNNGSTPATNFPLSYVVNGGAPVTGTFTGTIAPNATAQHCFTTKANFATPGAYAVTATVNITGDADATNNSVAGTTLSKTFVTTFPYSEGFETNAGGWTASGINSTWALGTPAGTVINSAAAGTKSWKTNLTGNYMDNENSAVTSPCFNFTNVANPTISMKIWWDTEFSWDGAVLQSSINGGTTWQNVGANGDPNNWYNDNSIDAGPGGQAGATAIGWSGSGTGSSGGWVTASHALTGLGGQAAVQLRIAFASDGGTVNNGFAFDEISISNAVAVPTITAAGPTTFCTGGSVVLTAASTTTGVTYAWFKDGTAITGATSATYTATSAGNYTVTATLNGSATSTPTIVTVNAAAATPTVTAGGSTTICAGSSVVLTAASTTTGATYQWFENGTAISGATNATFTANAAGSYTVVATAGGCASAASSATAVTVTPLPATPTITQNGGTLTSSSATGNQWLLNGTAIAGATGQTYVTTANGNYTVVVTANGCASAPSAARNVTNTGVKDALAGMSVDVYPNPATGSFNVKLTGYQKDAAVVLYNLAGQKIATNAVTAGGKAKNISLKGLAAGTYLLKVTSDKGVQVTKLVVE